MNPIDIACIAASAGAGAGFSRLLNLLRLGQDAVHELADQDEVVTDWKVMAAEVGEELQDRQKARSERVDTLRTRYLRQLEIDAQQPEEATA